jgi:hypothetical protein
LKILQLLPRQRFPYLRNPTNAELEVFPNNGIAISSEHFELLKLKIRAGEDKENKGR